jgi:hypothetical protein
MSGALTEGEALTESICRLLKNAHGLTLAEDTKADIAAEIDAVLAAEIEDATEGMVERDEFSDVAGLLDEIYEAAAAAEHGRPGAARAILDKIDRYHRDHSLATFAPPCRRTADLLASTRPADYWLHT